MGDKVFISGDAIEVETDKIEDLASDNTIGQSIYSEEELRKSTTNLEDATD